MPRSRSRRSSSGFAASFARRTRGRRPRRLRPLGTLHPARPRLARVRGPGRRTLGASSVRAPRRAAPPRSCADVASLPALDGAVVATTTSTHARVVEELLERGVPVFCEKPLTDDADAAARLAARAPDRLFVMDKWRYHPGVRRARRDLARRAARTRRAAHHHADRMGQPPRRRRSGVGARAARPLHRARDDGHRPGAAVGRRSDRSTAGSSASPRTSREDGWWQSFEVSAASPVRERRVELQCDDGVAVLAGAGTSTSSSSAAGVDGPRRLASRRRASCRSSPQLARSSSTSAAAQRRSRALRREPRSCGRSPSSGAWRALRDRRHDPHPDLSARGRPAVLDRERARPGGRVGRALRRRGRRRGSDPRGGRALRRATRACASSTVRRGRVSARRIGTILLEEARGRIVAYLADDDLLLRDHVASMLELLEDADFAHPPSARFDADGTLQFFPWNYARAEFREVARGRRGSIGLTGDGAHDGRVPSPAARLEDDSRGDADRPLDVDAVPRAARLPVVRGRAAHVPHVPGARGGEGARCRAGRAARRLASPLARAWVRRRGRRAAPRRRSAAPRRTTTCGRGAEQLRVEALRACGSGGSASDSPHRPAAQLRAR